MSSNKSELENRIEKTARNVLLFLENKTDYYKSRVALGIRSSRGWNEYTYNGISMLSRKLASYLIRNLEVKKGDRLALLTESRPEFGAVIFASVMAGTTTVPLDIKLTKYELKSILSDCCPTVMVVSNTYLKMAREIQKEVPSIQHIISLDETENTENPTPSIHNIPLNYDEKWRHRSGNATALIVYTSGTTGAPKGVQTTFNNMLTQVQDLSKVRKAFFGNRKRVSMLSILPMNHLFEMSVGFCLMLNWGFSIYYTKSLKPKDICNIMREKQINFMIVVPAFLKLLKSGIEADIKNASAIKKFIFHLTYALAKFVPSSRVRRFMFRDIHERFGRKFFGCMSGGAPLDSAVGEFFERIGVKVFQGYGLSETSPVVSINTDKRHDATSVGKPLDSFTIKIDSATGELMVKGPCVMKGYYNQPELTASVINEEGWLHTGDIAEIDKDGHIHITGRIKNLIVLSGGKKVFPEEVEAVLGESPNFQEVCVFGAKRESGAKEGTEDIVAVIVPTEHYMSTVSDDAELEKRVREEVKELSTHLAHYKRPVNIIVKRDPLPKTATNKVKRKEVKELVNV